MGEAANGVAGIGGREKGDMMYARKQLHLGSDTRSSWQLPVFLVCLALIAVALLTRDALAQETTGSVDFDLRGTVVDQASGQSLTGAFVSMTDSEWGSLSNDEGQYRIPRVRAGSVSLTVELLGYETLAWTGTVAEGDMPILQLVPQAIVLEGLRVVTDRFRSRRNATATSVRAFDHDALSTTPQETVLDFVSVRAGLIRTRCSGRAIASVCFFVRGREAESVVYVDEMPVIGGLDYLEVLRPHELYMVEVYGQGRHIRVYTNHFMERAAKKRLRPVALLF